MRLLLTVAGIMALLAHVVSATSVVVDGQSHCAPVSGLNLIQKWAKVYVDGGVHKITLNDSDFARKAGASNPMVLVYCDQVGSTSADHLVFSLNGIGDSAEVEFMPGGRAFLGFVDSVSSDNEGGSTVSISGVPGTNYVDGIENCTEAPEMLSGFFHAQGCGVGDYTVTLAESDFGANPEVENHMVFVLCDQLDCSASEFWLSTLNGIGDANSFAMLDSASFYLGFIGSCGDNHGTSTVNIDADCMTPVAKSSWATVRALFR
ncbi:MAG: hypothetical protein JXA57_17920 [Armatimonadetes bacterium]|nr:hypothetical protein [Armatimonadota bacterium]